MEDSDNDAATTLWYAAGGPPDRVVQHLGRPDPHRPVLVRPVPGFPWPGWGLTTTTPADQLTLLRSWSSRTRC